MLPILIVALFTALRIGVPVVILITIGEIIKRRNQVPGNHEVHNGKF
jgi:hypothetical protein